jgi:hypothetical protein
MRILKKCRKKKCKQLFNAIQGVNLIRDKNGSLKAICPWCKHYNSITKSEISSLSLKNL